MNNRGPEDRNEQKRPEFLGKKKRVREYWNRLYSSTRNKLSRGAANINRMISWARNENWRRSRREDKK
jgi:hypothetical protein